ncbi:MAG: hypothetical protein KJ954_14230, partial [Alphaproteobacteria bacterium]|nr:hypothetical protein [Alphaproteobacteria bacterium]
LDSLIAQIVSDEEKTAKLKHETFNGLTHDAVFTALDGRLGEDWVLKKDPPVQFTKEDINAVAASRFFRGFGMTLLLGWVVLIGILAMLTSTFPIIPVLVYYVLNMFITIGVFLVYIKKQSKIRKELWQGIDGVK